MAKIGEGTGAAMLRQGLAEVRGALYADSNVAQPPSVGMYGTPTQGEVAMSRRDIDPAFDQEGPLKESLLEQRMPTKQELSREQREPQMDRG